MGRCTLYTITVSTPCSSSRFTLTTVHFLLPEAQANVSLTSIVYSFYSQQFKQMLPSPRNSFYSQKLKQQLPSQLYSFYSQKVGRNSSRSCPHYCTLQFLLPVIEAEAEITLTTVQFQLRVIQAEVFLTTERTQGVSWMKEEKGIIHRGRGAHLRCPVSTAVQFSLRDEGSTEYMSVRGR